MPILHAISTSGFYHLDMRGCLKKAAQLGYDGVEGGYIDLFSFERGPNQRCVALEDIREDKVTAAILAAQDDFGARVTGIHGPIVPLNAPNWRERLWIYKEAFRRMRLLGARNFTTHAGGGTVEDIGRELPLIERNIASLSEIAEEHGVTVCIESGCCPYEVRRPDEIAEMLNRNPRLGHTADLSHFFCQRPDYDPIEETIVRMGRKVRVVHVVDWDPNPPFCHDLPAGMGIIDWPRFLRGILDGGFDGTLCCENTPDAITTFLLKVRRLTQGPLAVLPPSTVGAHADASSKAGCTETDPRKILGHDPYMKRVPFAGVAIRWGAYEEAWDGTTLSDQLYLASLRYIKRILKELAGEANTEPDAPADADKPRR